MRGHLFEPAAPDGPAKGVVVIASATGVLSTYYHRYAAFLAGHGFTAITFDYRGIGASAPESLKGFTVRWHDWGYRDIDAVLAWARTNHPGLPLHYVGHSFGGFGVGLARESRHLTRILTVGAQHAHWRDYAPGHRAGFLCRWHLAMPLAALRHGYFPGRQRGWLEDLPRGVALDWARSRRDFTAVRQREAGANMRRHQRELTAQILAVAATDDPFATPRAMRRALAYTPNARHQLARISPQELDQPELGHFALFHARFADTFWVDTLAWLGGGLNPWAHPLESSPSAEPPDISTPAFCDRPHRPVTPNPALND
nr:alpha/beta fold hydrolase [Paeniglutamicibacter kerguelensis]